MALYNFGLAEKGVSDMWQKPRFSRLGLESEFSWVLGDGNLDIFTRKILLRLTIIGVPLLSILSFVAPWIFQVIFGKEWERAGVLVQWMAPWFVLQLLSSPVSMIFHVTGAQRTAMLLQIFGFFLRVGFVLAAWRINEAYVVEAYAISGAIFYGLYLMLIIGIMKRNA